MTELKIEPSPFFKNGKLPDGGLLRSVNDALDYRNLNLQGATSQAIKERHDSFVASICNVFETHTYAHLYVNHHKSERTSQFISTGKYSYRYRSDIIISSYGSNCKNTLSPYDPESSVMISISVLTRANNGTITLSAMFDRDKHGDYARQQVTKMIKLSLRDHKELVSSDYEPQVDEQIKKAVIDMGLAIDKLHGISDPCDIFETLPRVDLVHGVFDPLVGREPFIPVYSSGIVDSEKAVGTRSFLRLSDQKLYTVDKLDARFGLILDKPISLDNFLEIQS